jgi:hypothetical protein
MTDEERKEKEIKMTEELFRYFGIIIEEIK